MNVSSIFLNFLDFTDDRLTQMMNYLHQKKCNLDAQSSSPVSQNYCFSNAS